jgi:DNA-binding CsgD family transcriptional regulator
MDWAAVMPAVEAEDCPILQRVRRGGYATFKISDFVGRRELYRTSSFKLLLEPYGLADSLELRLAIEPGEGKFTFDRGGRDFSARDLAVLDALNRHLVQLYRKSESRRRLREALALHESTQAAVVLLEAGHRVAFASTAASELLDGYFGENGVGLPDAVVSWLGERRRGATDEPLRVDVGGRSLVVELVDGALLLEEQQDLPRLTPREREILDLVAEGRTNAEIAERLWVSPVTVRKHLENVYAKLGVHTRTAAVALIGGRSRPSEDR